jgi:hypothetical protein
MLDMRNIKTTRPSKSLDYKNRGPFTITRVINNMAYKVDLPPEISRLHNVFHPWLLHKTDDDLLPGQKHNKEETAEIELDDDVDYSVKAVLNC